MINNEKICEILKKLKKVGVVVLGTTIIVTTASEYTNFTDFKNDVKTSLLRSLGGVSYNMPPKSLPLNDIDLQKDILYVHDNGKRQIISENKNIEGYENEGVYIPSEDDVIAYVYTSIDYGYETEYSSISTKEINTTYSYIDDEFTIIDEYAPEGLSVEVSNVK